MALPVFDLQHTGSLASTGGSFEHVYGESQVETSPIRAVRAWCMVVHPRIPSCRLKRILTACLPRAQQPRANINNLIPLATTAMVRFWDVLYKVCWRDPAGEMPMLIQHVPGRMYGSAPVRLGLGLPVRAPFPTPHAAVQRVRTTQRAGAREIQRDPRTRRSVPSPCCRPEVGYKS